MIVVLQAMWIFILVMPFGHLGQNGQNTSCQCSPFMG